MAETKFKSGHDLAKYISTFFGKRNNRDPTIVEGMNYTPETLIYMASHRRADEITEAIVREMKNLGRTPFKVIDGTAGIGGNTLSFLDNPNIAGVVSYEIVPERATMLQKNISDYGFDAKSIVVNSAFQGVPSDWMDAVLYFDPPWIENELPGAQYTKADYQLEDIKLGGYLLEQWLASFGQQKIPLVAFRLPPGYQMQAVPGFVYKQKLLKNTLLIMAVLEEAIAMAPTSETISPIKQQPLTTQTQTQTQAEMQKQTEAEWASSLKNYLATNILPKIARASNLAVDLVAKMVTPDAMKIWRRGFTHETVDYQQGKNYEEDELLGDQAMGFYFIKYLRALSKDKLDRASLSRLKSEYMSKEYQPVLADKIGLPEHLRYRDELTIHMKEDMLEAFVGILDIIGDKFVGPGFGALLGYNFVVMLFKDVQINLDLAKGDAKTKIKEIFEGLDWGDLNDIEEFQDTGQGTQVTLRLTDKATRMLRELGKPVPVNIIAREIGYTKTVASKSAYEKALSRIRELGITDAYVQQMRLYLDSRHEILAPFFPKAQARWKAEGFDEVYFRTKKKRSGLLTVELIGVRADGSKSIIAYISEDVPNYTEGKKMLLEKYSSGQ